MLWLNHPSYQRACDEVRQRLTRKLFRLKRLRPIIFFCGGKGSARRDRLNEYLRKYRDWLSFYADEVFQVLTEAEPDANALKIESELAELADAIIVIAESPGTFAELGAFALSDALRAKLLPIVDSRYKKEPSFLRVGPIRWVDNDSRVGPAIWADFSVILTVADKVLERLDRHLPPLTSQDIRRIELRKSRRHLLLLVVLTTEILGPASVEQVQHFLEGIIGPGLQKDIKTLVALAKSLGLVRRIAFRGDTLYYKYPISASVGEMETLNPVAVARLRTHILSAIQKIPAAVEALELLAKELGHAA